MTIKKLLLGLLISAVAVFLGIVAIVVVIIVVELGDSNVYPRSHIRNDYYMVGIYQSVPGGIGVTGDTEVTAVDLSEPERNERPIARISDRYGSVSEIWFVDSTTVGIELSDGRDTIVYDLANSVVPVYREGY